MVDYYPRHSTHTGRTERKNSILSLVSGLESTPRLGTTWPSRLSLHKMQNLQLTGCRALTFGSKRARVRQEASTPSNGRKKLDCGNGAQDFGDDSTRL